MDKKAQKDFEAATQYVDEQDFIFDENRKIAGEGFLAGIKHADDQYNKGLRNLVIVTQVSVDD